MYLASYYVSIKIRKLLRIHKRGANNVRFHPQTDFPPDKSNHVMVSVNAPTVTPTATPTASPSGRRGDDVTYPAITPTVTATAAPTAPPTVTPTEAVVPTPTKTAVAEETPTAPVKETPTKKKDIPGFTAVFAIAGLLAIAYAIVRRRR